MVISAEIVNPSEMNARLQPNSALTGSMNMFSELVVSVRNEIPTKVAMTSVQLSRHSRAAALFGSH